MLYFNYFTSFKSHLSSFLRNIPTLPGHSAHHLHQTKARDGEQLLVLHSSISSSSSSCFGAAFSRFLCDSLLPPGWHCQRIRFEFLKIFPEMPSTVTFFFEILREPVLRHPISQYVFFIPNLVFN